MSSVLQNAVRADKKQAQRRLQFWQIGKLWTVKSLRTVHIFGLPIIDCTNQWHDSLMGHIIHRSCVFNMSVKKFSQRLSTSMHTSSPRPRLTGADSPVSMLWSTREVPWVTNPSRGTLSPGLTSSKSPTATSSTGTSAPAGTCCMSYESLSNAGRHAQDQGDNQQDTLTYPGTSSVWLQRTRYSGKHLHVF